MEIITRSPELEYSAIRGDILDKFLRTTGALVGRSRCLARTTGALIGRSRCLTRTTWALGGRSQCLVMLLMLLFHSSIVSAQFDVRPTDQTVTVGERVTLLCTVSEGTSANGIQWWFMPVGAVQSLLYVADVPQDQGRTNLAIEYDASLRQSNLVIDPTTLTDNAKYRCRLDSIRTADAWVIVQAVPATPTITTNTTDLREGNTVSLTCTTNGANPQPQFAWYKDGQVYTGATTVTPSTEIGGTTSSVLVKVLDSSDNVDFRCQVWNVKGEREITRNLNVLYVPQISLIGMIVKEGTETRLSCSVSANPAVLSVQWKFQTRLQTQTTFDYTIAQTLRSHAGTYKCVAENGLGSVEKDAVLDVHYPPTVVTRPKVTTNENLPVNITCDYEANPPPTDVRWLKAADTANPIMGQNLEFPSVQRQDAAIYTCEVTNQLKPTGAALESVTATGSTELVVEYAPYDVSITPVSNVNVGSTLTLQCNAQGVPPPTFTWEKISTNNDASVISTSSIHEIQSVTLSDAGVYRCTVENNLGSVAPVSVRVVINEPPQIDSYSPNQRPAITTENFTLECTGHGVPAPQFRWLKNGVHILKSDDNWYRYERTEVADGASYQVSSVLLFRGFQREHVHGRQDQLVRDDTANYTCEISATEHENIATRDIQIIVQYPPLVSLAHVPFNKLAVDLGCVGCSVEILCNIESVPAPNSIAWNKGTVDVNTLNTSARFDSEQTNRDDGSVQMLLRIRDIVEGDLAVYVCEASNDLGTNNTHVSLVQPTNPDPPRSLTSQSITWGSVYLHWLPGFNGGHEQTYFIKVKSLGTSFRNYTAPSSANLLYNVTSLLPGTEYDIVVAGRNSKGFSVDSDPIKITTPAFSVDSAINITFDKDTGNVAFITTGSYRGFIFYRRTGETEWESEEVSTAPNHRVTVTLPDPSTIKEVRVSLCLQERNDICSERAPAAIVGDGVGTSDGGLPSTTVVIVGVVCAVIIIALIIVLVIVLLRRKKGENKDYESETNLRRQPLPINGVANNQATPQKQGIDNPDFVRDSLELKKNNIGPPPLHINHGPNHLGNHSQPHDTSYDSQESIQKYRHENAVNSQQNRDTSFMSSQSHPGELRLKQRDHELESGYSTPEPAKKKKVPTATLR